MRGSFAALKDDDEEQELACLWAVGVEALAGFFEFGLLFGEAEAEEVFASAFGEESRAGDRGYAG